MKTTLARMIEELRTSFWFVPAIMLLGAVALSIAALWVDYNYEDVVPSDAWWLFGGGDEGARAVLAAIAGSMITVASVVFSITILTLTLASAQFGSRLLQNFMRDTGNQVVLGTFIATFIYSLLVLRSVRDDFVPYLSITLGVLLVFVSVAVLTYFIHHVATKIQAESVVAAVFRELSEAVDRLFPESGGRQTFHAGEQSLPDGFEEDAYHLKAEQSNYLQAIEYEQLMKLTVSHDIVVRLLYRPGDFVIRYCTLLLAWPAQHVDDAVREGLHAAFILGMSRTLTQDAEQGIHQLVEIAVRALSPGVNDPFTAINCIDRLTAVLCQLTQKSFPSSRHFDKDGKLRIVTSSSSFLGFVDAAFNQIRQNAASSPSVLIHLMEAIGIVAELASTREHRNALRIHAEMVRNLAMVSFTEERDKRDLDERFTRIVRA
jgi:uncharacterized membrane protein